MAILLAMDLPHIISILTTFALRPTSTLNSSASVQTIGSLRGTASLLGSLTPGPETSNTIKMTDVPNQAYLD